MLQTKQIDVLFSRIKIKDDAFIKKMKLSKLTIDSVVTVNYNYQSHFFDFKFIKTGIEAFIKSASRFEIPLITKKIGFIECQKEAVMK